MKLNFIIRLQMLVKPFRNSHLLWIVLFVQCGLQAQNVLDYVDPMIGSGGHGHVFVGANVPFGAVQVGPNNIYKGWDWCSGYHRSDSLIIGFSQMHLSGTGIGDLADVLIMPYTGAVKLDKGKQDYPHQGYLSTFSHKNEIAKAGYYQVKMDNGVKVELGATARVGYHRYHFPKGKDAHIIIDLKEGINDHTTQSSLKQIDEFTLVGTRFSSGWAKEQQVYFAIKSSVPLRDLQMYDDLTQITGKVATGKAIKGLINFKTTPGLVELKVGISPVSTANALANIVAEVPNWDFKKVVRDAQEKWEKELSQISVKTRNKKQKRIFYTSLYHAFMHPSLFNDHNQDYRGADNKVYKNASFDNYTVFSTWDTYRATHPLFDIVQPERTADFINTMLAIYEQQGYLPIWHLEGYETGTMVGISSMQIIAEAYLKGIKGFDVEKAYEAVRSTAMSDIRGLDYVQKLNAIPSDKKEKEPVANAMELAIGDGSIALMAKAMGNEKDYEYFKKRAQNYKLYYDKNVGFFRGKMSDGSWNPEFDPLKSTGFKSKDFTEGNAWQYLWLVPQDVPGLIGLLGGDQVFENRLDEFFNLKSDASEEVLADLSGLIGQYAHGNEPSHHIAYLYNYVGKPWKTQEKVRQILDEFYHDMPDGVIGNEDCGQMSSWFVFSALGFYPVFPASQHYVIGSPLVEEATIHLPNGKDFTVKTQNNSAQNIYVQKVLLNGKAHPESFIRHADILNGGTLTYIMGAKANKNFGASSDNRPKI